MELLLLVSWFGMALGAAVVAGSKNRSRIAYFILALILPIVGILVAIGVAPLPAPIAAPSGGKPDPHEGQKKCPACAEWIMAEAKKCKHCGEMLGGQPPK